MTENFARGLFKTLATLKPYLPQIVIGGGWAPFLYYRYLTKDRRHAPVLTNDIDLMVRHRVTIVGLKTIDEILTLEAKLTATFKSRDIPSVIHYEGAIDGVEVEIEFLIDQTGARQEKVLEVQKGWKGSLGTLPRDICFEAQIVWYVKVCQHRLQAKT